MSTGGRRLAELALWGLSVACLLPALLFNIASTSVDDQLSLWSPGNLSILSLNVASVIVAPVALLAAGDTWRRSNLRLTALFLAAGLLCVGYNMTNALDKVARSRSDVSEGRQKVSTDVSRLTDRRQRIVADIVEGRKRSQGVSADVVEVDLATYESSLIFKRTQGCRNVKVQESIDWCAIYRNAEARLKAAKEVRRLEVELAALDAKLEDSGPVASEADPQLASIALLLNVSDQRFLAALMNARAAILVEIIGTIGPMVFHYLLGLLLRKQRKTVPHEPAFTKSVSSMVAEIPGEPEKPLLLAYSPIERFTRECLETSMGETTTAANMYLAYLQWCKDMQIEPTTQHAFGTSMADLGFEKFKKRNIIYRNVRITKPDRSMLMK
jgi:hypothetical protein